MTPKGDSTGRWGVSKDFNEILAQSFVLLGGRWREIWYGQKWDQRDDRHSKKKPVSWRWFIYLMVWCKERENGLLYTNDMRKQILSVEFEK